MDLSEFLLARIAEDEGAALLIRDGDDWHAPDECTVCDATRAARDKYGDPARVLAECEAKRRIVEHEIDSTGLSDGYYARLLATPYADHPDYNPEWKV